MDKVNISILGCCVSRDTVDFNRDKYIVKRYTGIVSPYTILSGAPFNLPIDTLSSGGISNFISRCISLDAKNKSLDYLAENKGDWLLLDLASSRLGSIYFREKDALLTYNRSVRIVLPIIAKALNNSSYEISYAWQLPIDVLLHRTENMLDQILSIYKPENIILNEFYFSDEYISKTGILLKFDNKTIEDNKILAAIMRKVNYLCKEKLTGCHVIEWPDNVLADESHRWGLYPLHFHKYYYEYADKAIQTIIKNYDKKEELLTLESLRCLYSQKFNVLRSNAICNSVRADRDKWKKYSDTFRALAIKDLLKPTGFDALRLETVLYNMGFKKISIFGDTALTRVLINLLGRFVKIEYIVCEQNQCIKGYKIVSINLAVFPKCDMMLVADIINYNTISAQLRKLDVSFPFYNAAEFMQSLPAWESGGMDIIKKYKDELSEQLSVSVKNEAQLAEQLNDLTKQDIASRKTIDKLNNDIKLMSDNKNKILAEKQKAASERDVALSELDAANSEIQAIRNSISFKVGRGLTLIPRKIRDFIKAKKK